MEDFAPLLVSAFIGATALYIAGVAGIEGDRQSVATRALISVMIAIAGFELGEVARVLVPGTVPLQDRLVSWWVAVISTGWYVTAAFHVRTTLSDPARRWTIRLAWSLGITGVAIAIAGSVFPDLSMLSLILRPGLQPSKAQVVFHLLTVIQVSAGFVGALVLYMHAVRVARHVTASLRALSFTVVRWFIPATICLVITALVAAGTVLVSFPNTSGQPIRHVLMSWPVLMLSLGSIGLLLGAVRSNRHLLGQPIYVRTLFERWAMLAAVFGTLLLISAIDGHSPRLGLLLAAIGAPALVTFSDWREYRRHHDAITLYKRFIEHLVGGWSSITPQSFTEQAKRVFDGLVTTLAPAAAYLVVALDRQDSPLVLQHRWEGPAPDPQGPHQYDVRPIVVSGQRIGTLALIGPGGSAYSLRELDLAESYADSIAHLHLAGQQARAIEQLMVQRTRDREEMIQRIGRVLHDKVVANLDAIEKNAQVLGVEAKGHENGFVKDLVSDIRGAARESMALLRNLVYDELLDPYPVRIDREGLVAAIQQDLVPQVQARYRPLVAMTLDSGNVRDSELNIQLDGVTRRTLFAAVEEAVRNAVKHGSKPGRLLRIAITLGWDDGVLMITVADNGAGFHPELAVIGTQGMGLRYHQAALRFTGGVLAIESQPGHGATVRVRMPLHAPRSITDNATMRTLAPIRHV